METLKEKTAKGLFWGAVNSGSTQILNVVIGIFLARLLSPSDYGLIGMLTIFSAVAGVLQESGFIAAIINLKEAKDKDYNAVFWFSTIIGISCYCILFISAPFIARFFHQPVLTNLSRFIFLSFVLASVGTSYSAYMNRNLMNKEKAIIGIISLFISGIVGITLAFAGMAYWSLAWQQFTFIATITLGRLYYVRWHPSLKIDFTPIKNMFGFSCKILITNIINTISINILSAIFGRLFSSHAVGNYTQANKWNNMAYSFISTTVAQVAQPIFSSINNEQERQKRVFRKMLRFTAFLSFPAMFGLALVSREFLLITISDKWLESVVLLQILCISGAFYPLYTIYQNIVISKGRSDIFMWCNIGMILLQVSSILAFYKYGITTMVTVYTITSILWLGVWQHFVHRLISVKLWEVVKDIAPFALSSVTVMGITYIATQWISNLWMLLLLRISIAGLLYYTIMKVAHVQILDDCTQFIKSKIHRQ